jgi:hypothetical protein
MFGLKKLISKIEVVINSLAKTPHLNRRVTESGMGIGRLVSIAPRCDGRFLWRWIREPRQIREEGGYFEQHFLPRRLYHDWLSLHQLHPVTPRTKLDPAAEGMSCDLVVTTGLELSGIIPSTRLNRFRNRNQMQRE